MTRPVYRRQIVATEQALMPRFKSQFDLLSRLARSEDVACRGPQRAPTGEGPESPNALTVSEVASLVKATLLEAIPGPMRVVGEVSNFFDRNHWFFSLKDEQATLRCVCFASKARGVGFQLEDGIQVVAVGRLDFFDTRGELQLYVDRIEPVGQGVLEMRFRALCDELRRLGYFEIERKKPLPQMPQTVAVITSRSGAALQDVIDTTAKRWPGCRLLVLDVRVQGVTAAPEIAEAIHAVTAGGRCLDIDALILTRGGGSIEDLWAFNERVVAEAIYHCSVPVVAAIGHETDTTIAELVADLRCATPTQAVMKLVPDRVTIRHQLDHLAYRIHVFQVRQVQRDRQRLEGLANHPIFRRPGNALEPLRVRVERLSEQLAHLIRHRRAHAAQILIEQEHALSALEPRAKLRLAREQLRHHRSRLEYAMRRAKESASIYLEGLFKQLRAVNPNQVLQRGYSYTIGPDGRILRSRREIGGGDRITTVLGDGRIKSRVESLHSGSSGRHDRRTSQRHQDQESPPTLFD